MEIKERVEDFIQKNKNEKKASFDKSLIKSKYEIMGIKTSLIESFAKILAKENIDIKDLPLDNHEEILLAGMVIGYKKITSKEKLKELNYLLPYIDDWGSCDCIVPRLKGLEKEREFFINLLESDKEFYIRVGIIWLMKFMLKSNLKETISLIKNVKNNEFYVEMAKSWAYAEACIYDFDFMFEIIKNEQSIFVKKKAIQKAIESFRVKEEDKVLLKEYRGTLKS